MEIKTYGITEANKRGLSGVVKDSERDGLVMLRRDSIPVALIVPLNLVGLKKFFDIFSDAIATDIKMDKVPEELKAYTEVLTTFIAMSKQYINLPIVSDSKPLQ